MSADQWVALCLGSVALGVVCTVAAVLPDVWAAWRASLGRREL